MAYLAPLEDAKTLKETMMKMVGGDTALDDRAGTMNKIFAVIPKLPQDSELSKTMNDYLITMLYNSLPHPPTSYVGEDRFRKADGSRNNVNMPDLGRAGTTYARNVQGRRLQPPTYLPPTSMVYDELLKATGSRDSHPGGNSSMTFAFASLVTHSLFRTDPSDWGKNNTSSYLDLSPLYGSNEAEQDLVRVKDGRGLLHPDTFSEGRLVFLPPASGALLVIWNRNHNYIANNILKINEQKRWSDPPPEDPAKRAQQDKEIFETARLINCVGDYVAGFLGLGREGSSWSMQPFDPIKGSEGEVERGEGNHCSVEFNVLYRWHAVTSEADEKWTSDIFDKIFSKKSSELELSDFYEALGRLRNGDVDESLRVDADPGNVISILHNSTESVARRYGARGSPEVLRIIEIMGMEQARKWGVCTMNEFRKYLGLKTFKSFEEWNSDPVIANAARKLYKNIDDLELYPGLHAEECMKLGPGSGLCAGYTITRGILSDAICLLGFEDVKRDPNNGAFGAYLPKLLLRTLPRHYTYNSVYGLFPDQYDFKRPSEAPIPKPLNNFTAIKHVSNDIVKYKVPYGPDMKYLTYDRGMFLIFDEQPLHDNDRQLAFHALFPSNDVVKSHVDYYSKKIKELIACRSSKYDNIPGTFVDIIDVINKAAVHWASENLCGIIPKYEKNPNGEISDEALYQKFAILFSCVFRNTEPYLGWALRRGAKAASDEINGKIKANLERIQTPPIAAYLPRNKICLGNRNWADAPKRQIPQGAFGKQEDCQRPDCNGSRIVCWFESRPATAQMVEFYMDDAHKKEREHIFQLASKNDDESTQLLAGYYREAARLNPQFPALVRIAVAQDEIPQSGGKPAISVKPGDRLFCSYRNAHLDPELFPNPEKVDPRRPKENYAVQATGTTVALSIPAIMRAVFGLKNLRPAPGVLGTLESFDSSLLGTKIRTYIDEKGCPSPWPTSLVLVYDS
ncbi:heme peroxidase [Rhizoctonia solani]|uniref:Heme peroxidase n=1 Tax=Rhizoctonia solani TaxID=456999 RepID=A0A8H7I7N9_9AGAM|nr:heme peroxidase [Rhizoctonia solani]